MEIQLDSRERILSFRSHGVMYYTTPTDHRGSILSSAKFMANASKLAERGRYVGMVTAGAYKRIKKAITLLIQSTPWTYKIHPVTGKTVSHQLSFVTLTTPKHDNSYDAKWCHKNLLEPLLRTFRRKYGMKSYIWKCELQANGQVHYHVTTDFMINHSHLKNEWNNLLRKHDMLELFRLQYGHDNPNSTDVHAVASINNMEAYLVKYICKAIGEEAKLNAKVWDCSKNIKKADYFKLHVDARIHEYITSLQSSLLVVTSYFERAIFLNFRMSDYYSYFSSDVVDQFAEFLNHVRGGTISQLYDSFKSSFKSKMNNVCEKLNGTVTKRGTRICYENSRERIMRQKQLQRMQLELSLGIAMR